MSRAALWRQEGNVKERERRAEEIFAAAVAEGRQKGRQRGVLQLWGPDDSFHFNALLLKNTIHSPYFQKACQNLKDWNAVIDQIYYEVKHLEPFSSPHDKTPSTAFCLLLRMLTLRMTDHQMESTLKHPDSPYIRAIGFLYLRFAGPPDQIFQWIEPYLFDHEPIQVEGGHRASTITIGEFVRKIFDAREYYGTPFPRFPLQTERDLRVRLLQAERIAERAAKHFKNQQTMRHFQNLGSQVMALYGDDENPTTWYNAVVDRVISTDEAGFTLKHPKFVVTFTEYGNTETVNLGEMDTLDGSWRKEDPAKDNRHADDLYDEVRRRDRDTVTASKGWARPPPSTKNMLSQSAGPRRTSVQDDPVGRRKQPNPSRDIQRKGETRKEPIFRPPEPKKRSAEEEAAIAEKKRRLQAKYG
jgi:pre-mRNA-splicing factor 38B